MIERNGDVFTTTATYIGHGVNCEGKMGAGIAKTMREEYPHNYKEYKRICEAGLLQPGSYGVTPENGRFIVNFATQRHTGKDARYEAVFKALYYFSLRAAKPLHIEANGNIIAIPEIGCGIGGLEWSKVAHIIRCVEAMVPEIEYEVWHYV